MLSNFASIKMLPPCPVGFYLFLTGWFSSKYYFFNFELNKQSTCYKSLFIANSYPIPHPTFRKRIVVLQLVNMDLFLSPLICIEMKLLVILKKKTQPKLLISIKNFILF